MGGPGPGEQRAARSIFAEPTNALSSPHPRPGRGRTTGSRGHTFLCSQGPSVRLLTLMSRGRRGQSPGAEPLPCPREHRGSVGKGNGVHFPASLGCAPAELPGTQAGAGVWGQV